MNVGSFLSVLSSGSFLICPLELYSLELCSFSEEFLSSPELIHSKEILIVYRGKKGLSMGHGRRSRAWSYPDFGGPALHAEAATQLNTLLTQRKNPVAVS